MYIPAHYSLTDVDTIKQTLNRNTFITMVSYVNGELIASHIPVLFEWVGEDLFVEGHFAKANPHTQVVGSSSETMIVVQSHHAYISPSDYVSFPNVPTWNYLAIHLYGVLDPVSSFELPAMLRRLVDDNEAQFETPYKWSSFPEEYIEKLTRAIVGFRMKVTKLDAKGKLSQNKPVEDVEAIIGALQSRGSNNTTGVASLIEAELQKKRGPF